MRTGLAAAVACALLASAAGARAEERLVDPTIDLERDQLPDAETGAGPDDAPAARPYEKTLVLDASLGALGFFGDFGEVAPPGPWLHAQLGYELLRWLMLFGEGEIAFTDTSTKQPPPRTRSFALFGAGVGARFTARFTDRFGAYAQASLGMMKADIGHNALGHLGFADAEDLDTYACGRLGVEWYQLDRHFALGAAVGARLAQGFARAGAGDTPLIGDAAASIRYAF